MPDTELVVVSPFGDHAIGDVVSEEQAEAAPHHAVVRRAKPQAEEPPPAAEPAPEAHD